MGGWGLVGACDDSGQVELGAGRGGLDNLKDHQNHPLSAVPQTLYLPLPASKSTFPLPQSAFITPSFLFSSSGLWDLYAPPQTLSSADKTQWKNLASGLLSPVASAVASPAPCPSHQACLLAGPARGEARSGLLGRM